MTYEEGDVSHSSGQGIYIGLKLCTASIWAVQHALSSKHFRSGARRSKNHLKIGEAVAVFELALGI